jgi:cytochrome bd-I ubiquinol oxidase subunit X
MLRGSGGSRPPFLTTCEKRQEAKAMWYFSWILGIGVALGFGIINVMWLDAYGKFTNGHADDASARETPTRRT